MTTVADELAAGLDNVPPEQRWGEMARIMAMATAAADLASGGGDVGGKRVRPVEMLQPGSAA